MLKKEKELQGFVAGNDAFNPEKSVSFNGNFSYLKSRDNSQLAVTDRFNSREILWDKKSNKLFRIGEQKLDGYDFNETAVVELIFLQRLFGNKTIFSGIETVPPSFLVEIEDREIKRRESYYQISFAPENYTIEDAAQRLVVLLQKAVELYTSDKTLKYGLLLSGGLDSRAVLAALPSDLNLKAYTIGDTKNNEYRVAKELAKQKNIEHIFVKRNEKYYSENIKMSSVLSMGKNAFYHAHFNMLRKYSDTTFLHGHGLDYFFQGTYLPMIARKVFGRNTCFHILDQSLTLDNIVSRYVKELKYRMKEMSPLLLFKKEKRAFVIEVLYDSLKEVFNEARSHSHNPVDVWEYMSIHNLSKHYTNLNLISMRQVADERTVAFENELFAFYLSLPHDLKVDAKVFIRALSILDKKIAAIVSSNTNLPANMSRFGMFGCSIFRKLGFRFANPPLPTERSWRSLEQMGNEIRSHVCLERLETVKMLDMDFISGMFSRECGKEQAKAILILATLSKL